MKNKLLAFCKAHDVCDGHTLYSAIDENTEEFVGLIRGEWPEAFLTKETVEQSVSR